MDIKILNAVIAIIGGIGGAIIIFWILNKLAESLKGKWEDRVKPWMFAGPAILAIAVYLIYPAVVTLQYSFANEDSTAYVGFQNYIDLFTDDGFLSVLYNNVLWIVVVPALTVVLGLGVAVLADRLRPPGEKASKTFIFLPMAISMVGAATIWRTIYDYQPEGALQRHVLFFHLLEQTGQALLRVEQRVLRMRRASVGTRRQRLRRDPHRAVLHEGWRKLHADQVGRLLQWLEQLAQRKRVVAAGGV